ncbi:hypothetical protein GCM10027300_07410 [Modestobacter lapidis]
MAEAPASNRSCACTPATPSDPRWKIATAYASSPTAHTTQARRGVRVAGALAVITSTDDTTAGPQLPAGTVRSLTEARCAAYPG